MANKKIDKLTPAQEAKIPEYVEKYTKRAYCTDSIDRASVSEKINAVYQHILKKPIPKTVEVVNGPASAWKRICDIVKDEHNLSDEDYNELRKNFVMPELCGSFDNYWAAYHDFFVEVVGVEVEDTPAIKAYLNTMDLGLIYPLDNVCIVTERPTKVVVNADKKLSSETGSALEYANDLEIFAIDGETEGAEKKVKLYMLQNLDKIEDNIRSKGKK
jgi:hypothetical protein